MKVFKRLSSAMQAAHDLPILSIGSGKQTLYIAGFKDRPDAKMTEVAIIGPNGTIAGHISLGHLDRLGNGNWAHATRPIEHTKAFSEG